MRDSPPGTGASTPRFSVLGKLSGILLGALALHTLVVYGALRWELELWLALLLGFAAALLASIWAVQQFLRPLRNTLHALSDGIRAFHDRDFSMRLAAARRDELGELLRLYNQVGSTLQEERAQIRERELLLQTALDQSPIAIVLVNALERVIYANQEAHQLFMGGRRLGGLHFSEVLDDCPAELRAVLDSGSDGIFTVDLEQEAETYHLARRDFTLNRRPHTLYLLRRMTVELARQEVEIWKKVIRIISHELNNSLAPVSSLAHSGRIAAEDPAKRHKLDAVFDGISERVRHLTGFLEGYARFARLPTPRKEPVEWAGWLGRLRELMPFRLVGDVPSQPGLFDPSQLEQVVINLVKNAEEAGSATESIELRVERLIDGRFRVEVADRGRGMSEEVMRQSLLPFYSTKQSGTGVGLPLCREIVEAHGGALRIQSRGGGGTLVSFWLPGSG